MYVHIYTHTYVYIYLHTYTYAYCLSFHKAVVIHDTIIYTIYVLQYILSKWYMHIHYLFLHFIVSKIYFKKNHWNTLPQDIEYTCSTRCLTCRDIISFLNSIHYSCVSLCGPYIAANRYIVGVWKLKLIIGT
jgi:hypothetical protein